jgi:hypothetical protein
MPDSSRSESRRRSTIAHSPFVIKFSGNVNRLGSGLEGLDVPGGDVLQFRPHDVDIEKNAPGTHAIAARVLHFFWPGAMEESAWTKSPM